MVLVGEGRELGEVGKVGEAGVVSEVNCRSVIGFLDKEGRGERGRAGTAGSGRKVGVQPAKREGRPAGREQMGHSPG